MERAGIGSDRRRTWAGRNGGTGGGSFRAGVNGVACASATTKPDPPYSEEARKAKYQAFVFVEAIIETDDRVTNIRIGGGGGGVKSRDLAGTRRFRQCGHALQGGLADRMESGEDVVPIE